MENEICQVCGKEIKGSFTWVACTYWNYHPVSECGTCVYPVGNSCIKKIPKEFHGDKDTVENWHKEIKERNKMGECEAYGRG